MEHLVIILLAVLLAASFAEGTVEMVSQKIEIVDNELIQQDFKIGEDGGTMTLDGTFTTTKPMGEEYSLTLTLYADDDMLFQMKQNSKEIMNGLYKDHLMEAVHGCSNLPYFEGEWQPPFEAKTYKFEKCTFADSEELSQAIDPGKYKVVLEGTRGDEKVASMEVVLNVDH